VKDQWLFEIDIKVRKDSCKKRHVSRGVYLDPFAGELTKEIAPATMS
jgi:hypothetical protein